ncbi:MAG: heavy metal sensor histidine kinase [Hydrogenophaga sp.]|jgi:two-component system heavy metal sensor histidine kinase CusS|nr:heavy metal sensor histidine kinase [Hydrogenophaga sp.]
MLGRLSLTTRLTAFYALVSATVLVGLAILVAFATSRHFVELDRGYLQDKIGLVQKIVGESPSPDQLTSRLDELLDSHHGLFIDLRQGDRVVYGTEGMAFPSRPVPEGTTPTDWTQDDQTLRGLSARIDPPPTPSNEPGAGGAPMQLLIALDTGHHLHFMRALSQTLALYSLGAILVSGFLGWWAARRGLAPLRIMKERAMTVTAQKLDQRMPVEAVPVEFADLAESLNTMLGRLQVDFVRLQAFSSDLAHELRTPINNLLTQTQVSLAQKRDVAAYQDILASNAEEFQRLARMVSDMLLLAKTEHGVQLPSRERVSLHEEVLSLFDYYDAVADEKHIRMALDGTASVAGDRLMLRRAISNLMSNAIRHSADGSDILISIQVDRGNISLCVTNHGTTIAPEHLPRLFDRFYRVDKSRSHPESDGTGLGLSITRAIMAAHGGSVSVTSDKGTTSFCLLFQEKPVD